ncbi:MAG: SDR family oxidoreductase [Chitinophagaceae bacterium]|nr:SDR family oxidoreductase [Rubrivivax sp.]
MKYATYPSLAGQRVLITGGGSGIGATFVEAFAGQGARVAFIDVAQEASLALVQRLSSATHPPQFLACDLRELDALAATIAAIHAAHGATEVLINNAANDTRHALASTTGRQWDDSLAVNLRHLYFCAQAVVPGMQAAGAGVILNLGSISWHRALADLSMYMTAKAAIEGMTRGLARDLGAHGIRVNTIVPGSVRTPRQSELWYSPEAEAKIVAGQCLPERVEPEDVAAMALFLASDNAARCSGREYFVDAGWYGA